MREITLEIPSSFTFSYPSSEAFLYTYFTFGLIFTLTYWILNKEDKSLGYKSINALFFGVAWPIEFISYQKILSRVKSDDLREVFFEGRSWDTIRERRDD